MSAVDVYYISLPSPSRSSKLKKARADCKNVFIAQAPAWTQSVARQQKTGLSFIRQDAEQSLDVLPCVLNKGKQFEKGNVQNMQNFAQVKFIYQEEI